MTAIGAYVIGDEILSGKRADKHLAHLIATLAARGLGLDYAHYVGDDRGRLTALLPWACAGGVAVTVSRAAPSARVAAVNGRSVQSNLGMEGLLCRQCAGQPGGAGRLLSTDFVGPDRQNRLGLPDVVPEAWTRLRRRVDRRLQPGHHESGSFDERAAFRTVPQPGASLDARFRHRFLLRAAQ